MAKILWNRVAPVQQAGAVRFTTLPLASPFWVCQLSQSVVFTGCMCAFLSERTISLYPAHSTHLFFVILAYTLFDYGAPRHWEHDHRKFKYMCHLLLPLSLLLKPFLTVTSFPHFKLIFNCNEKYPFVSSPAVLLLNVLNMEWPKERLSEGKAIDSSQPG